MRLLAVLCDCWRCYATAGGATRLLAVLRDCWRCYDGLNPKSMLSDEDYYRHCDLPQLVRFSRFDLIEGDPLTATRVQLILDILLAVAIDNQSWNKAM